MQAHSLRYGWFGRGPMCHQVCGDARCGPFVVVADYPAQVFNWHDNETPPSLADALSQTRMALCGGLCQWETMVRGTPESVRAEALRAFAATQGRLLLSTGCVTPIIAPTCNLVAARHVVDGLKGVL